MLLRPTSSGTCGKRSSPRCRRRRDVGPDEQRLARLVAGAAVPIVRADPATTWLWSDPHLGDRVALKAFHRPFRDVAHMDRELLARWRAAVSAGDTLICLGDVAHVDAWREPRFARDLGAPGRAAARSAIRPRASRRAVRGRLRAPVPRCRARHQPGRRPHARPAALGPADGREPRPRSINRRLRASIATCRWSSPARACALQGKPCGALTMRLRLRGSAPGGGWVTRCGRTGSAAEVVIVRLVAEHEVGGPWRQRPPQSPSSGHGDPCGETR